MTVEELREKLHRYPGILRVVVDPWDCNEYHDVFLDQRTDPDTKVEVLCMEDAYIASVEDGLPDVDPREHDAGCPRKQFWDAGERQCPCTCEPAEGDELQLLFDHHDAHLHQAQSELARLRTLYAREVQGGLDLRAELADMEHLKDEHMHEAARLALAWLDASNPDTKETHQ